MAEGSYEGVSVMGVIVVITIIRVALVARIFGGPQIRRGHVVRRGFSPPLLPVQDNREGR